MALRKGLPEGPRSALFLMSEVPLYPSSSCVVEERCSDLGYPMPVLGAISPAFVNLWRELLAFSENFAEMNCDFFSDLKIDKN